MSRSSAADFHEAYLTEMVLDYLAEHPQAADTLEGIAEWWVMRQQARLTVERLARVLGRLTERGVLEVIGTGSQGRYRLRAGVSRFSDAS